MSSLSPFCPSSHHPPPSPCSLPLPLPLPLPLSHTAGSEAMDSAHSGAHGGGGGGGGGGASLPAWASVLGEGVSLVLSRWTALQMAVENSWGGRDSRIKADDLAASILSWFAQSKEIEDGSVEEVAEQLMIMHEDCLKGNYESIEKLRNSGPQINAVSQSIRAIDDNEDESADEEESEMAVDEAPSTAMAEDRPKPAKAVPDEEGWSFVAPRRSRGKRSG